MRPNLNDKSEKLIKKIQSDGVNSYKSQADIVEKALLMLWKSEKELAYQQLNEKRIAFYQENPNEAALNMKLLTHE